MSKILSVEQIINIEDPENNFKSIVLLRNIKLFFGIKPHFVILFFTKIH